MITRSAGGELLSFCQSTEPLIASGQRANQKPPPDLDVCCVQVEWELWTLLQSSDTTGNIKVYSMKYHTVYCNMLYLDKIWDIIRKKRVMTVHNSEFRRYFAKFLRDCHSVPVRYQSGHGACRSALLQNFHGGHCQDCSFIFFKMFSVCFFAFLSFFFWLSLFCELIQKSSGGTFLFLTDVWFHITVIIDALKCWKDAN